MKSSRLQILYRCPNFILVNKPPGMLCQPPDYRTHNKLTLLDELQDDSLKPVHRLDTNVTGGIVVARNKNAAKNFHRNLSSKNSNKGFILRRKYMALVETPQLQAVPKTGVFSSPVDGKDAETKYRILDLNFEPVLEEFTQSNRLSLILLELITGRKHQIREHLRSCMDTLCVNDLKYGSTRQLASTRQIGLHSCWVNTKVGMDNREFFIPVIYGQDSVWGGGFIDANGEFIEGIKNQI